MYDCRIPYPGIGTVTKNQCFGLDPDPHGSALILLFWIRIRLGNADPDPGAKKLTKINNFYLRYYVLWQIT